MSVIREFESDEPYRQLILVEGGEWEVGGQCPVRVAGLRCTGTLVRSEVRADLPSLPDQKRQQVVSVELICSDLSTYHYHPVSREIEDVEVVK